MRSRWQVQTRNLPAFGMSRPDFWIKSEFFSALGGFPSPTMPCYRRALVCQTSAEDLLEREFKLEMTKQSCSCKFSNCPPIVTFVCNCVIIEFCSLFIISKSEYELSSWQNHNFGLWRCGSLCCQESIGSTQSHTPDIGQSRAQSSEFSRQQILREYHLTLGQCRTDTF